MVEVLLLLAQCHESFRRAELESLAEFHHLAIDFSHHDEKSPFLIIQVEKLEDAKLLISRSILTRAAYELWSVADSYEKLHEQLKASPEIWQKYQPEDVSFKFNIISYQGSRTKEEQLSIIESFSYMDFKGPIRMKNPDNTFTVLEQYAFDDVSCTVPDKVYFGRFLSESGRSAVDKFDLKRRRYIGTTSFEAELALVTCNIGLTGSYRLMFDPFAGTGSFLVAAGHYGSLTIGSDIDPRIIRGKGQATIPSNFQQYNIPEKFLDVMAMDFTHAALRNDLKFDCIICDPPYGVREGLKVLGSKNPEKVAGKEDLMFEGEKAYLRRDYIAPKKPYELGALLDDLLEFAANRLLVGRRLCFWMPTANDDFTPTDIPRHRNLELIYNCEQVFNKWSRRLLVYVRREDEWEGEDVKADNEKNSNFRAKYFRKFT